MQRTSQFVDIDGPVHYVDYGGSGPPVVMIHGLGGSHLNWERIAPGVSADHHPYAIDMRGFGLTPLEGADASIDSQIELVARFIEEVAGGPAIVFGNSFGGTIALVLADRRPDLVAGLALFAPGLPPQSAKAVNRGTVRFLALPLLPGVGEKAMQRFAASGSPEERITFHMESMTAHPARIDPATKAALVEMRRLRDDMEWAPRAYCQALRSAAALTGRRRRFREMIHRIGAPTLILHGMLDDTVPFESAEWLARERPDWRFAPLADCGHVPQLELPKRSLRIFNDWRTSLDSSAV
jgi:pimeloyl-ACP methyl ester carboxylesterase